MSASGSQQGLVQLLTGFGSAGRPQVRNFEKIAFR